MPSAPPARARYRFIILKYDKLIPQNEDSRKRSRTEDKPVKGIYQDESQLVQDIRKHVVGPEYDGPFKTIECSIMDIAHDIAYSTYDLEDTFKGGFLTPLIILAMPDSFKSKIVAKVQSKLYVLYSHLPGPERKFSLQDYDQTLLRIFSGVLEFDVPVNDDMDLVDYHAIAMSFMSGTSDQLCRNGYYRTEFTSELVGRFIRAINVEVNEKFPTMSQA